LGIRALLLVNAMIGLWLSGVYIYVFSVIVSGGTVGEPDAMIAKAEFWLSIVVTCWFLWQVPYWVLRLLRETKADGPLRSRDEESQRRGRRGG